MDSLTHIFAYIDPGSGSFLIQVVVGALLGASVALKMYWYRLKSFFAGRAAEKEKDSNQGE